jgi:hypothetical protein
LSGAATDQQSGQEADSEGAETGAGFAQAGAAGLHRDDQRQRGERIDRGEPAEHAGADGETGPDAHHRAGDRRRAGIFLQGTHQRQRQENHGDGERRVLRVHEHVAVIKRAGGEQGDGNERRERAADPARQAPGDENADQPDAGADQPPRLEQVEREHFGGEGGQHALVGKAGRIQVEQQPAVFGMGVIIPTEAIIVECQGCDDCDRDEDAQRKCIRGAFRRSPPRPGARHGSRRVAVRFPRISGRVFACSLRSLVDEQGMNCGPAAVGLRGN